MVDIHRKHRKNNKIFIIIGAFLAVIGIIGLTIIFSVTKSIEISIIYTGLLATFLLTMLTSVLSIGIGSGLQRLVINTNSRMDQLIEATKEIAYAAGLERGLIKLEEQEELQKKE